MKREPGSIRKERRGKISRRRTKASETPRPFADIRDEVDWTSQKFIPASPANMVPISPTSSPAVPVTKEKVQLPGVTCSPLSPLPQGLEGVEEFSLKHTPPPYITLDSTIQGASFDVKLKAYDTKKTNHLGGMGSLASFNHSRRKVELHLTMGLATFPPVQRKDPKQMENAIQEKLAQLKKLQTEDSLLDLGVEDKPAAQKETAAKNEKKERKEFETPGAGTPTQTISNCSTAAFDASQLSLLQSYMKQNGGVVPF
eukprot:CAMPEP_0184479150 /NCGR_PEP_ID=MMETSP0113_2-20130426/983_1 /TAXON_ID=91329 /ORGANISM="Norrisiella sphaerica, Strain BC52" /LENGTH=255 /DNA_ID=CAMNT_0026857167 /DNA_START=107 /DNA_END=874 /DNA_ORIENTATION=+